MEEFWDEWGNKQNDAIGALLFKIGDLELKGDKIIRDDSDLRILIKLVDYLTSVEYWHDKDNGMWEEHEEIHASSVGACVAGLKRISKIIDVDPLLIKKGEATLSWLLPNESETKKVDLALLSLIYPYNVVDKKTANAILNNVEEYLVRERGVIRYLGDKYYSNGKEAEWTKGFPWLAIAYKKMNNPAKYAHYMRKTLGVMNAKGEMPELYYSESEKHNENSPLGWSQALYLVAATT
jgi:phosphorylase kinase alpha/beta subunit